MKEPMEMIKFFAVNMKIGKQLKECAMIDLDNDAIYTQRDLDEEREAVIDKVLEIIDEIEHDTGHVALIDDENKFAGVLCNSREFRDRVLALKGGAE